METSIALILVLGFSAILLIPGIWEKQRNEKYIRQIPIRINVNGIRGKSTATRLITAILQEAGYRAIGKTTGTAARMIYWDTDEEKELIRKPHGVRISEQLEVIEEAAELGADALVCECMAIRPEYQATYQHQMLKSTITVIVNVLEDHLDEMGPTTRQIAWAFAETIPYHGIAVIPDCEYTSYFMRVARKRGTICYVTDDSEIDPEYLDLFSYKLFDHNCAVALAVSRALHIPDEVAYRGMLKAHPDPGALQIREIGRGAVFVNGFAANDPASSLEIWEIVKDMGLPTEDPIVVMNCRPDRVDRTQQFVKDFLPYIPNATLLVIGESTRVCTVAYRRGKLPNVVRYRCIEGTNVPRIMGYLETIMADRLIFGVGNIHGIGEEFIEALMQTRTEDKGSVQTISVG